MRYETEIAITRKLKEEAGLGVMTVLHHHPIAGIREEQAMIVILLEIGLLLPQIKESQVLTRVSIQIGITNIIIMKTLRKEADGNLMKVLLQHSLKVVKGLKLMILKITTWNLS